MFFNRVESIYLSCLTCTPAAEYVCYSSRSLCQLQLLGFMELTDSLRM